MVPGLFYVWRSDTCGVGMTVIELRCPAGFGKLLGKYLRTGMPLTVDSGNLAELPCPDCKSAYRKRGDHVRFVLHRFNVAGELIETEVVR